MSEKRTNPPRDYGAVVYVRKADIDGVAASPHQFFALLGALVAEQLSGVSSATKN